MARILNKATEWLDERVPQTFSEWFEQVEPQTFSEREFEARILLHAPSVYPEYYVMPFKQSVESPYGNGRPDLVFIAKDYSEWRVVEVEMAYHDYLGHVDIQIQRFANASYESRVAEYLLRQNPQLDRDLLLSLITNTPPQVLLIVNAPVPDWASQLTKYGAILAVFELFRSSTGHEIFRVNGEYPTLLIDRISPCFFHPFTARLLGIEEPDALELPRGGHIRLYYNNCITEWTRVDGEGKVWLQPVGRNPLNPEHRFEIYRQSDGSLVLRRLNSQLGDNYEHLS